MVSYIGYRLRLEMKNKSIDYKTDGKNYFISTDRP